MVYIMNAAVIILAVLWRKGRILQEDSEIHRRWMRAMCIGKEEADEMIAKEKKKKKQIFLFVVAGCIISTGICLWQDISERAVTELQRPAYGSGDRIYELEVKGLNEGRDQVRIPVREQQPDAAGQQAWLEQIYQELRQEILGDNVSLQQVTSDLIFPASYRRVQLQWQSDKPEILSDWGELMTRELPEKGTPVEIWVELSYREQKTERTFSVIIFPSVQGIRQARIKELEELAAEKGQQITGGSVELPETYQGNQLTYYRNRENLGLQIGTVCILLAAAVLIYWRQQPEKQMKQRSRQLELDYPEVVTRLIIYVRAGMNIRGAWERIAREYSNRKQEGAEIHYVYEEMLLSCYRMESGIAEAAVYGEFGRQCGLHCYLRLSSLLEQSVRKGGAELLRLLEQEAGEAFQEQKNLVKKIGEESGTKMLVPMSMMLGIILVIVIVPTFSGFGI